MSTIELSIRYQAKCPMLASDAGINSFLRDLNETFERANESGMSIGLLSEDEMRDIEVKLLAARISGIDEAIMEACDSYIALLRQKGVPETLLPKRNPSDPLRFLE